MKKAIDIVFILAEESQIPMRHFIASSRFAIPLILLIFSCGVFAQGIQVVPNGPLPAINDATPRIQPNASGSPSATIKLIPRIVYEVQFDGWENNHLHWPAPSSLTVYNDGTFLLKAAYLANMLRTGPFLDTGDEYYFLVTLRLIDKSGRVVWADWMQAASLDYKHEAHNVETKSQFSYATPLLLKGYTLGVEREINHRLADHPPRIIPAPSDAASSAK